MSNPAKPEGDAQPPAGPAGADTQRRERLRELAQQASGEHGPEGPTASAPETPPATLADVQAAEIVGFVEDLVARDRKRRQQLGILKQFLDNPVDFGLDTEVVPTSSTPAEIAQRRKELQYKIDLLRNLLELMQSELTMLDQAQPVDKDTQSPR